jgi:hypothetical protein
MSRWVEAAHLGRCAGMSPYVLWDLMRPDLGMAGTVPALCLGSGSDEPAHALLFDRDRPGCATRDGATDLETVLPHVLDNAVLRPDLRRNPGPVTPPSRAAALPQLGRGHQPVLLGIIDDAIPFAHEHFRLGPSRSRVAWLWLQGARHDGATEVPCGREYWGPDIDDLLAAHRRGDAVDEAALYRDVGMVDPALREVQSGQFRETHGAAVADIAGGFGPRHDVEAAVEDGGEPVRLDPAMLPLAFVCLPSAVIRQSSGVFAQPFIIEGIRRILELEKTMRAGGIKPAVIINISMGITAGPKDGGTMLEQFMDCCIAKRDVKLPPLRFVLPAGNHRLAQTRASVPTRMQPDRPLFWRLPPDDGTPSFLEFWGPLAKERPPRPRFGLTLHPPVLPEAVETPPDLAFDHAYDLRDARGALLARLTVQWREAPGGGRENLTLAVPPTLHEGPGALAPPGDWRIELMDRGCSGAKPLTVDVFVQRDDTLPAFKPAGRQSRLHDPAYAARMPGGRPWRGAGGSGHYVSHDLTINAYATGEAPVIVGGHYRDGTPVEYAGEGGVVASGKEVRTDVAALADRSPWLRGVVAAGTLSGSASVYGGTSVAAPRVVREIAKAIVNGRIRFHGHDRGTTALAKAEGPDGADLPRLLRRPELLGQAPKDEVEVYSSAF